MNVCGLCNGDHLVVEFAVRDSEDDDDGVDIQSLVVENNEQPKQLFKNKISGKKASEMTFERERKMMAADEVFATR